MTSTDPVDRQLATQLAPLIENAMHEVDELARGRVDLAAPAREGLGAWLRERLMIPTRAVLRAWAEAHGTPGALDAGAWSEIFGRHPDLVPIVEGMISEWRVGVKQFLARYAADAELLGETSVGIRAITVSGGGWKRSPTLRLETDGSRAFFYKNHPLEIGAWLMELLFRLNDAGLPYPLHVRTIHARPGDYGWDEEVRPAPCNDRDEVERYFVRCGMWLRLLQVLAGNDLHSKNLVAAGEHPVPIDHESLLQPLRNDPGTAAGSALVALQESPLEVGLLPRLSAGVPGRRAFNAGGLEAGGECLLPFDTPDGYPRIHLPRTLPTVGDEVVTASGYGDAIFSGYKAMQWVLSGSGERELEQMLMRVSACPVRVLSRPLHETRPLIIESLQPEVLARRGARDKMLTRRAHPNDLKALTECEVPRHYELPLLSRIRRTRTAAETAWDRALITTAIACAGDETARQQPVLAEVAPIGEGELVRHAVALGDLILAEGYEDRRSLRWLGVRYHPLAAARSIELLPDDLLSGNAGLAVVLAALARATNEARFAEGAKKALQPVAAALAARTPAPKWRPWGAYVGSAGQLYAVERVGELLGSPGGLRGVSFERLLATSSGGVDLATGTAGMVAVMARRAIRPPWLSALGGVLAEALRTGLPPLPYPDGEMPPYLPDPKSSVVFALERMGSVGRGDAGPVRDPASWDVGDADLLVARYLATGSWFPGSGLSDRLNLSGMLGIGAVLLALLREALPHAKIPSLWRLD